MVFVIGIGHLGKVNPAVGSGDPATALDIVVAAHIHRAIQPWTDIEVQHAVPLVDFIDEVQQEQRLAPLFVVLIEQALAEVVAMYHVHRLEEVGLPPHQLLAADTGEQAVGDLPVEVDLANNVHDLVGGFILVHETAFGAIATISTAVIQPGKNPIEDSILLVHALGQVFQVIGFVLLLDPGDHPPVQRPGLDVPVDVDGGPRLTHAPFIVGSSFF